MSETALPVPQKRRPTSRTKWLTTENLRHASSVLQVGLSILEGHKKTKPVARALRVATTLGAAAAEHVNGEGEKLLEKLRMARDDMKTVAGEPASTRQRNKLRRAQTEVFLLLDLFLEQR